jgi:hypothetical protein
MRVRVILALSALLVASAPAIAQKVYIDYDREADFDSYETFSWLRTSEVSLSDTSPLLHSRVKNAIELALVEGGLIEVDENPDLWVTYYGEEREEMSVNTSSMGPYGGYGYGPGWGYDPVWDRGFGVPSADTEVTTFAVGTLVIDLIDADSQRAIWRGSATATIPLDPRQAERLLDKAIRKLVKRWRKMKAKGL